MPYIAVFCTKAEPTSHQVSQKQPPHPYAPQNTKCFVFYHLFPLLASYLFSRIITLSLVLQRLGMEVRAIMLYLLY